MLNRMLRYADAIVKRGVDKLIDASDIVRSHKVKILKRPNSKNAWATTLTVHRKRLETLRTAV